ncbi:MAG: sulfotransferase [Chitinophagales bacterium]
MDFFILGNPRSGTTLLRLMLNSHSLIGVPPESGFLQWWHEKYRDWNISDSENIEKLDVFLDDVLSSKKIEYWEMDRQLLKEYILKNAPGSYIEIIDCIYKFYCKNKLIIGDKNNYYIHHLDEIQKIAPRAKYIHIVRDGRDVACSYMKIKELDQSLKYIPNVSFEISEIAKEWNENLTKIENFVMHNDSLTIRYEDLISKPKMILSKVCDFLEVNFEKKMLSYNQKAFNDEPVSNMKWKKKTFENLDSTNKGKYLTILSENEIQTFNKIAIENLKRFDYE